MSDFPYTLVPSRLRDFLERIPADGIPPKLTLKVMEARGFKSSNDRSVLRVARALGLIEESGTPTEMWRQFRDRSVNRALLGESVKSAYQELFDTYPDAYARPDESIRNFMQAKTAVSEPVVRHMVNTFKTLCALADFDADTPDLSDELMQETDDVQVSAVQPTAVARSRVPQQSTLSKPAPLQITLHIHLPDTADPGQIDHIFQSMARYLLRQEADDASDLH